jgi:predicted ATP-dependent serine protease
VNKKVLFISLEEFEDRRISRNKGQLSQLEADGLSIKLILENYFVVSGLFPRYLVTEKEIKKMIKVLDEVNPDVVIIDSLSRMYKGAIESSEKAQSVIQPLKNFSDNRGIPVIIVHHTTKLSGKQLTMDSMAGSRLLSQEADAILGVGKLKNGMRFIKPLAYRYADDSVDKMPVFEIDNSAIVKYVGHKTEEELEDFCDNRKRSDNKDQIAKYILSRTTVSTAELEDKFVSNRIMARSTLFDNLEKLDTLGLILKPSHGIYQKPSLEEE